MLKVLPIQSKSEQEELCRRSGIVYNPDLLAYAASVDGCLVGICQFKLSDEGGLIYDIARLCDTPDASCREARETSCREALFVMGRAALNFIDLCGVHKAYFVGEVTDAPLLSAIGFERTSDGRYEIDLEGFFTDHCH